MSLKENNEITVKIIGRLDKFYEILENRNYKIVDKFDMEDTYFIPQDLNINEMSTREIISKAVLVRDIIGYMPKGENKKITFKIKKIDENGDILSQKSINCKVNNVEDAKKLLLAIGYKKIMTIRENDIVYEKDDIPLTIKNIKNGDNLIEMETSDKVGFRTIEDLKNIVNELDIPIEKDKYFIKKAEVELDKILKDNSKRKSMVEKYKVITLCGSTKFKEQFMEVQKKLTLEGNIVLSLGLFEHSGDNEVWKNMDEETITKTKKMLNDMHKKRIEMADEIYVINVGGYIGTSTKSEIEYAKKHGKKVNYLENIK